LLKLLFRVLHVLPAGYVAGIDLVHWVSETPHSKQEISLLSLCGLLMLVSGIANYFLLAPKAAMKARARLWIGLYHLKLLLFVLTMTPAVSLLSSDARTRLNLRVGLSAAFFVQGAFMRFYREAVSKTPEAGQ
jgi:hypothetical protein